MSDPKAFLSDLLSKASKTVSQIGETVKDKAEKGKEIVEDKFKEREAAEVYKKLGCKIYKLNCRKEIDLPESCQKYIDQLNDIYEDDNKCCCEANEENKDCCKEEQE